jgi:hypothetical protein
MEASAPGSGAFAAAGGGGASMENDAGAAAVAGAAAPAPAPAPAGSGLERPYIDGSSGSGSSSALGGAAVPPSDGKRLLELLDAATDNVQRALLDKVALAKVDEELTASLRRLNQAVGQATWESFNQDVEAHIKGLDGVVVAVHAEASDAAMLADMKEAHATSSVYAYIAALTAKGYYVSKQEERHAKKRDKKLYCVLNVLRNARNACVPSCIVRRDPMFHTQEGNSAVPHDQRVPPQVVRGAAPRHRPLQQPRRGRQRELVRPRFGTGGERLLWQAGGGTERGLPQRQLWHTDQGLQRRLHDHGHARGPDFAAEAH